MKTEEKTAKLPLIRVEISRAKWLRGDEDASMLLDREGNMCCLGFAARTCGFSRTAIYDQATPDALTPKTPQQWEYFLRLTVPSLSRIGGWNNDAAYALIDANDNPNFTAKEREKRIKELGKKAGFKFVFKP